MGGVGNCSGSPREKNPEASPWQVIQFNFKHFHPAPKGLTAAQSQAMSNTVRASVRAHPRKQTNKETNKNLLLNSSWESEKPPRRHQSQCRRRGRRRSRRWSRSPPAAAGEAPGGAGCSPLPDAWETEQTPQQICKYTKTSRLLLR